MNSEQCFLLKMAKGIWAGMIGGTAVQTFILAALTIRCDWNKEVRTLLFSENYRAVFLYFCASCTCLCEFGVAGSRGKGSHGERRSLQVNAKRALDVSMKRSSASKHAEGGKEGGRVLVCYVA